MNMKRTWQGYGAKFVFKVNVEQTVGNEGSYFYLYPFGDLVQKSFQGSLYVCIK